MNTQSRRARASVDRIAAPQELREWLRAQLSITLDRAITDVELARIHGLRDAIRALLHAAAHQEHPSAGPVATINDASAAAPRTLALEWSSTDRPRRHELMEASDPLARAASTIANDAIELLTDERGGELVECAAPGCVRFLLRDHPRRHWCSAGCGERARAARYYRRHAGHTP